MSGAELKYSRHIASPSTTTSVSGRSSSGNKPAPEQRRHAAHARTAQAKRAGRRAARCRRRVASVRPSRCIIAICDSVFEFVRHQSNSLAFIAVLRCAAPPKPSAAGTCSTICTSRSGSAYGSGRSSTAFTTLKIAAVAPSPTASVSTVMIVRPGVRLNPRSA